VSPAAQFWLGSHTPAWLGRTDVPLFVSRRRLARLKNPPAALGPWALDSGGFSELSLFGRWTVTPRQYVREVCLWLDRPGKLAWAACMDWMCEPFILAKTGGTVRDHQKRTTENYLTLMDLTRYDLPLFVPVLQGWEYEDYLRHAEDYAAAGVDLAALPLVGLGSVCRRQDTSLAEVLVREFEGRGVRVHGFGVKLRGLARVADVIASADSLAWSYNARRNPPLPGCLHKNCNSCLRWALRWREKVMRILARPTQAALF
jgi:hypothetical protein